MADGRRGRADDVDELLVVDVARRVALARLPHDGAGPGALPCAEPLSIGPTLSEIAGMFTVAAAMMQAGMVLSQPVSSTTPSSGIAVETSTRDR
jgi:hypothetical protein